jgi:hypothetical protein
MYTYLKTVHFRKQKYRGRIRKSSLKVFDDDIAIAVVVVHVSGM